VLSLDILIRSVTGVARTHLLREDDTKFTRANNQVITNELHASKLGDNFGRILPGANSLRNDLHTQSGQGAAGHADPHLPDATTLGDIYCQIEPSSGHCHSTRSRPRTGAATG
jgi:hypothetical protein